MKKTLGPIFGSETKFSWGTFDGGVTYLQPRNEVALKHLDPRFKKIVGAKGTKISGSFGEKLKSHEIRWEDGVHIAFRELSNSPEEICAFIAKNGFLGLTNTKWSEIAHEPLSDIIKARDILAKTVKTVVEMKQLHKREKQNEYAKSGKNQPVKPWDFSEALALAFELAPWQENLGCLSLTPEVLSSEAGKGKKYFIFNLHPKSLISALTLFTLMDLSGPPEVKLCKYTNCRKPFTRGPGCQRRGDAETCCDSHTELAALPTRKSKIKKLKK